MYLKLMKNNLKKHPAMNLLILIQMITVLSLCIIIVSAIDNKTSQYNVVKKTLENNGMLCNGYFIKGKDKIYSSTNEIKSKLKGVDNVYSVDFSSLNSGENEKTGEMNEVHSLIYDDYTANLFVPKLFSGKWINNNSNNSDLPQAVITENCYGYKVGDIAVFNDGDKDVKVQITGVIADGENYLSYNTKADNTKHTYKSMFAKHFSKLHDELKNDGSSEEQIKSQFKEMGYADNEIVYNQPILFFSQNEWKKVGCEKHMSDLLFVCYNKNISNNDKLYNQRFINQKLNVLSYAVRFSEIEKNSVDDIYSELYTLLPIMIAAFILMLLGAVSVNAINCKNQMRDYSILYLCGSGKIPLIFVSILYSIFISLSAMLLTALGFMIFKFTAFSQKLVILFGIRHIVLCSAIIGIFIILSAIIPIIMLSRLSPKDV